MIPCRVLYKGDYVAVKGVCCKVVHKAQLVVVKEMTTGNRMFLCGYDCVEPIPLSVGFFKRNGFEMISECGGAILYMLYRGDGFSIKAYENFRSKTTEWCVVTSNGSGEVIRQSNISSVSQFQMFIRFAYIDIEVNP